MIDMKREKEQSEPMPEERDYPYGLCIHLDKESLEKLGMTELPEIGAEMLLHAKVKVTSVCVHKDEDSKDKNVGMQITAMEFEQADRDMSEVMYGS